MKFSFLFIFILCCGLTLFHGETPWNSIWEGVVQRFSGNSNAWNPLLDERIPRLIILICTGASLAVSGAIMQAIFYNPLASPSVLGITCGGSLCVTLVMICDWHYHYPYCIPIAAVTGCLLALFLIYVMSRCTDNSINDLILSGIALSTLLIAIQGAILYALRDQWHLIQTITEWEAGTTIDRTWKHVHMQLPLTLVGLIGSWVCRHEIDILSLGDEEALSLGVDVNFIRWKLFLYVALLTGGAIAAVGIIAFFGLVMPHIVRLIAGASSSRLIPYCILFGSIALTSLDFILRYFKLHTFSIGNVSAILGGLFFLFLLMRSRNTMRYA